MFQVNVIKKGTQMCLRGCAVQLRKAAISEKELGDGLKVQSGKKILRFLPEVVQRLRP